MNALDVSFPPFFCGFVLSLFGFFFFGEIRGSTLNLHRQCKVADDWAHDGRGSPTVA